MNPIRIRARTLALVLLGGVIAVTAAAAILLVTLDWRPRLEAYASRALDRQLAVADLRITWRNPLALELTGLRLANASWGSRPDMLSIERLSAAIDLSALLHGVLRFEIMRLEKPVLLLERNAEGTGNWHFNKTASMASALGIVPKNRAQFPTLIAFALHDGQLTYRATSSDLRIDFHDLAIRSAGDDDKVSLTLEGAYNGIPTRLTATTDSYAVLRNEAVPFGSEFSIVNTAGAIGFRGTMTEPLDFEGVRGRIDIDAKPLGAFLRVIGTELRADFPVAIGGAFERSAARWHIAGAQGRVAANRFVGTLSLTEGSRGAADALATTLDFAELDLAPLIGSGQSDKPISLRLESHPAATVDARIAAKRLTYETRHLADAGLALQTRPGAISVSDLSFAFAGGKVAASGTARNAGSGSRIVANAALTGADADAAARSLAVEPGQLAGRLDGRLTLEMTGATLNEAIKTSSGQAVLAMADGRVSRDLIERASTDLRSLFRPGEGWMPVSCLLGIVVLRNGLASIGPLRLRTPQTTLVGFGQVNLTTEQVDMVVKTEAGTTSLLALHLPLHIAGKFDRIEVAPSLAAPEVPNAGDPGHLATPELQLLAERSRCRH